MDHKILTATLILLTLQVSAYNVSEDYYVNESAGLIIDEAVNTMQDNETLTTTAPLLFVVLIILLLAVIPFAILMIALIYVFKRFTGGVKGG